MELSPEVIQGILYLIIIVAIVVFLVKKAVKIAILLCVALLIFNIGFRFTGEDVDKTFNLGEYVETETANKITSFFDDFESKREEYGIVDTDKVYNKMTDTIEKGYYIVVDGLGKIDINKFAKTLAENIYDAGLKDIDFEELVTQIEQELNVSTEEATEIAKQVEAEYQSQK